jgi:prepilin-type processing-associated H-X9-DG protein
MQYRLSTIFLVFFVVAASLAMFGTWGLFIAAIALIIAVLFHLTARRKLTIVGLLGSISLLGFIVGLILPAIQPARESGGLYFCFHNMEEIGAALHGYHDAHKHFPPVMTRDKDGKPLFSWSVEILPNTRDGSTFDQLFKDEPWDSPRNSLILSQCPNWVYACLNGREKKNDISIDYIAIIGPGTMWRSEGAVSFDELPNDPSLTVAVVESVEHELHWAEPYELTAEEVLARMQTGKGARIASLHPEGINVLFADGSIRSLSNETPISVWRKLLMGEFKSRAELNDWTLKTDATIPVRLGIKQPPPPPGKWPFVLSVAVWLISLALLFYRACRIRPAATRPEISAG